MEYGLGEILFNRPDLDITGTIERKEKVLILPENTLRFMDMPLFVYISKLLDKPIENNFETVLYKLVCRKDKNFGKLLGEELDSSLIEELSKKRYADDWDLAPRTNAYSIIETLRLQKFVDKITVLFPMEGLDPGIEANIDYYDGTYEGLLEYMKNSDFTALFIGDAELLYKLAKTRQVDFNLKTIFLSRIGYNYSFENGIYVANKHEELVENFFHELCSLSLFTFDKNNVPKGNDS